MTSSSKPEDACEKKPADAAVPDEYDCYCGLGPTCPHFLRMTDEEKAACSRDKRQYAQAFFKNGM